MIRRDTERFDAWSAQCPRAPRKWPIPWPATETSSPIPIISNPLLHQAFFVKSVLPAPPLFGYDLQMDVPLPRAVQLSEDDRLEGAEGHLTVHHWN